MKKKVVFCGTHPCQYNGYSKVVYGLCEEISKYDDVEMYIFGFQNIHKSELHQKERVLSKVKDIFDAHAEEAKLENRDTIKHKGFGISLINDYVDKVKPDIIIIYNDLVIINNMLVELKKIRNPTFKIIPYIDLIYKNEKNNMIRNINANVDGGIMFTEHWKREIVSQGFTKPLEVLEHGFDNKSFYPIPKKIARKYYNIDENAFVIVNLNRNQPRKRWDICIMAYVKFIKDHLKDNIKLMIATSLQGSWDLADIMISECRKHKIRVEDLKEHLIFIQNPQRVSDREINIMYNLSDIGINTCDGEGFGLCNFEQAGVGVPQIVPNIGGFLDFFDKAYSIMINPQWSYYSDHSRDSVCGEAEVCSIDDYVDGMNYYFNNKRMIEKHGEKARQHIMKNYSWVDKGKKFYDILCKFIDKPIQNNTVDIDTDIDIDALINNKINDKAEEKKTKESIDDIDLDLLIEKKLNSMETMETTKTSNQSNIDTDASKKDDEIIEIIGDV